MTDNPITGTLAAVVLDAPDVMALAHFYSESLGWSIAGADASWATLTSPDGWRIGIQHAPDHVPPQWPDPAHPQQFHLDLYVPDIDAAARQTQELGAVLLGGGDSWHTLADPAGHPFDLCRTSDELSGTKIYAITLDCPDPASLAAFYGPLLDMPTVYSGDQGVVIGGGPHQIIFQRIDDYRAPIWGDPTRPQQMHVDITVSDVDLAEKRVLELGASRLSGGGDDFRVFADPAGHPFCLVW